MCDSTGQSAPDHEGTDRRCVDCDLPVPYSTEPCAKCRQYVCDKCSDPTEGICLACPNRAREQEEEQQPVTYKLLAKMIRESEDRIRYDQMMKRRAFEERVKMQYRDELKQMREEVADMVSKTLGDSMRVEAMR